MKKGKAKDQDQKQTLHRLSLNRETIRVLNDPALLEQARGGKGTVGFTGSEIDTGCIDTTGSHR